MSSGAGVLGAESGSRSRSPSFAVPTLLGWLRRGRLTGYPTWGAKTAAVAMPVGIVALLLLDAAWAFRVATGILAASALERAAACGGSLGSRRRRLTATSTGEEIAITARLPRWRADVPGPWALARPGARPSR